MMKAGAAESAPLLQKLDETNETPKPGAIAAAARQAKRGVGVFGVALALSGVLVAVMTAPDKTKKRAAASYWQTYWQSMGWLFLVICCLTLMCSRGVLYYLRVVRVGIACHVHVASMAPRVTPSTRCPTQTGRRRCAATTSEPSPFSRRTSSGP